MKRFWTGLAALITIFLLIFDGKTAINGANQGISLCIHSVIPSLFPFFLLSNILTSSFLGLNIRILKPLAKIMNVPDGGESLLLSSFLGGYPVGAQCISRAYQNNQLSRPEAERLLAFCNNAGPSFLFGILGSAFSDIGSCWKLWCILILSAVITSWFFPGQVTSIQLRQSQPKKMTESMHGSLTAMASVCGWILFFRVVISFLERWILWLFPIPVRVLLTGILELSNGCLQLATVNTEETRLLISTILLTFGGLCVSMQTASVAKPLSLKKYWKGKLIQTFAACLLVFCWLKNPFAIFAVIFLFAIHSAILKNRSRKILGLGV